MKTQVLANKPPRDTQTVTSLPPRWLQPIRVIWAVVTLTGLSLFMLGLPDSYANALRISAETAAEMAQLGLPLHAPAMILIAIDVITMLVFTGIALLIVFQRSNDWLALVVSLLLIVTGLTFTQPAFDEPAPTWLIGVVVGLSQMLLLMFLAVFPDGRWFPRFARWLPVPIFIWKTAVWALVYVPAYRATVPTAESYGRIEQNTLDTVIFLVLLVGGIVAQVYRYRRISGPQQRQQAKWLMYSIATAVIVVGAYTIFFNTVQIVPIESTPFLFGAFSRLIRQIAVFTFPASLAIAVLRYRLWDIDFIINRSLVYGSLTLLLVALMGTSLLIITRLLQDFTGGPAIAVSLSAVMFGIIFQPARRALRQFVDRRLYGIEIEYQRPPLPASPHTPDASRTHIGPFNDLLLIGRGGMAEVYQGWHPKLNCPIAVKVLLPHLAQQEEFRKRFEREAGVIARLKHPNIVRLFEYGEDQGTYYMVMEFIEGQDLSDVLDEVGRMPLTQALSVIKDIASALDYAHAEGMVHRDIKPSNVMIAGLGTATPRAVLTDFGIVRLLTGETQITSTGLVGTFDYISPEQISASKEVDGHADIYSLGVMTFQMLSGRLPFQHPNIAGILIAHMQQPPPNPCDLQPSLPSNACSAILQAMSKRPEHRFATAGEFAAALTEL